jgi:cation diffusion facilitator CzcD-associated flavoprotein CzcO
VGGTGATGSEAVVQALKRGAKVTVLARTPSKMVQPPVGLALFASRILPSKHQNISLTASTYKPK